MSGPAKYRKRPVVVEAVQWTGDLDAIRAFVGDTPLGLGEDGALGVWVEKSKTTCRVEPGGWLIRERDGVGFYPCTASQFAETYEAVLDVLKADEVDVLRVGDRVFDGGKDKVAVVTKFERINGVVNMHFRSEGAPA